MTVTTDFPIQKGTRVRVVRGPLKGIEGEVEETPNGVQLIVGIQSLICARITIGRGRWCRWRKGKPQTPKRQTYSRLQASLNPILSQARIIMESILKFFHPCI